MPVVTDDGFFSVNLNTLLLAANVIAVIWVGAKVIFNLGEKQAQFDNLAEKTNGHAEQLEKLQSIANTMLQLQAVSETDRENFKEQIRDIFRRLSWLEQSRHLKSSNIMTDSPRPA